MKPFSVYVHVPYCARRCPYCDFNVHVVRSIPEQRYCEALLCEIDGRAASGVWQGREVETVFFGGGTPSLFGPRTYASLLSRLDERFGIRAGAEISWEANPEDLVEPDADLTGLKQAGITRITLGAQAFDAELLRVLGRMHAPAEIEQAVTAARGAGFHDIGIDLIFAVPGQSLERWRSDVSRAADLGATHVSTYGLTYEEGTSLAKRRTAGRIAAADEELEREMYESAIDVLTRAGYRHYEISNFALPGYESRHNLTYWTWGDYLGLGAGAHGFARCDPSCGVWGHRYDNVRSPDDYMQRTPHAENASESLDLSMAMSEFILLGLRRIEGFREDEFHATFGAPLPDVAPALGELVDAGLLSRSAGRVSLTRKGLLLADSVTARLADVTDSE